MSYLIGKGNGPLALLVMSLSMIPACRSAPTSAAATADNSVDDTPGLTVLSRVETDEPVTAAQLYPPKQRTQRYLITAGDADGSIVRRVTEEADRFGAEWVTVETLLENGETPRNTRYWSFTDTGSVVMHASIDHDDNAVSLFRPPLIIAYPGINAGDQHNQEAHMRVVAEDDPTRGKERGTARQTVVCEGVYTLRTPIGEVAAHRIIIEFEADMSMADATERTEMYVSAEHGIVAERRTRSVKVFGLTRDRHAETLVLAGPHR